ncbi:hypothetical protein ACFYTQ_28305 [Nocardia sp. NPDC004068]|uniref:hypothetical protein n=1 Tax=Nocardia sp. NPDC004068 TaxID=3364303 RepID=UPI0036B5038B
MLLLTDHPGWLTAENGTTHYRAVTSRGQATLLTVTAESTGSGAHVDFGGVDVVLRTFTVPRRVPTELAGLAEVGSVAHVAVPNLWEAVAGGIFRCADTADRGHRLWARFCQEHGDHVSRDGLTAWTFPAPGRLLALPPSAVVTIGTSLPLDALRAAAQACLAYGQEWETYPPAALLTHLRAVLCVGPTAVGVAVADYTGDYTLRPLDPTLRTAIRHLVPGVSWPNGSEFGSVWYALTEGAHATYNALLCAWAQEHGNLMRPTELGPESVAQTGVEGGP